MDFDFRISVHKPLVDPGTPLPVVYTTDANMAFGATVGMNNMLLMGGEMPPVLTIGIGYDVDDTDMESITTRRMYDFSPTVDAFQTGQLSESELSGDSVIAGGAPLFFTFMKDEQLWPWVSSHFNVSDDITYVGDSMGGLYGT